MDYLRELQSQQRVAPPVKAKAPAAADPLGGLKLQGSFKPASTERSTDGLMDGLGRPQPTLMSASAEALGPATTVWLSSPTSANTTWSVGSRWVDSKFHVNLFKSRAHHSPLNECGPFTHLARHGRLVRRLAQAYVLSKRHCTRGTDDALRWLELQAEDGMTGAGKKAKEQETDVSGFDIPDAAAIKAAKAKRERLRNAAGVTHPSLRLGFASHMPLAPAKSQAIGCDPSEVLGLTVFGCRWFAAAAPDYVPLRGEEGAAARAPTRVRNEGSSGAPAQCLSCVVQHSAPLGYRVVSELTELNIHRRQPNMLDGACSLSLSLGPADTGHGCHRAEDEQDDAEVRLQFIGTSSGRSVLASLADSNVDVGSGGGGDDEMDQWELEQLKKGVASAGSAATTMRAGAAAAAADGRARAAVTPRSIPPFCRQRCTWVLSKRLKEGKAESERGKRES